MICIILVAGHAVVLEREIQEDITGKYEELVNVPKALLPARPGKRLTEAERILDCWWQALKRLLKEDRRQFSEVYLITNAHKYKHYERWATSRDFPFSNIINDGSTNVENSLGAIADLDLAIRSKKIDDDIMVVAGDMLFDHNFDIGQVINYFRLKKGDLAIYYDLEEDETTENRGIIELDHDTGKIKKFLEKPKAHETSSRLASPVFYCFRKTTLPMIAQYIETYSDSKGKSFGHFMSYLVDKTDVYSMKLPTRFQLIGQISLPDYVKWVDFFSKQEEVEKRLEPFTSKVYARVGLMGNPSDMFNGKTLALSVKNFWSEVTITPSTRLRLLLHPLNDPTEFGSLSDLHGISRREGYLGGLRLMQATCKRFYQYCAENGIALAKKNFSLNYETNIPRQVGLSGSSAIIIATTNCLMHFFGITEKDIPKPRQAQFVLDVEVCELYIHAGLMDRVAQVYQGLVFMDFDKHIMEERGCGDYTRLDPKLLPSIWLAYIADPSDSGRIHSGMRERWDRNEEAVHEGMRMFGQFAQEAKEALERRDYVALHKLMDKNFDLRRKLYTDAKLGPLNLKMMEIGRKYGSATKFCGSGGAVIGLCLDKDKQLKMMQEMRSEGFVCCEIQPFDPSEEDFS